ncbi:MAG: DNA helicase, partial [Pseudomonadota bacterium]
QTCRASIQTEPTMRAMMLKEGLQTYPQEEVLMTLSRPIFRLKAEAKRLARAESIPHHEALDRIARQEGFQSWSLLAGHSGTEPSVNLMDQLTPGEIILIAARPGHGKTLLALSVLAQAAEAGRPTVFFSLEWTEDTVRDSDLRAGGDPKTAQHRLQIDVSEEISAEHIAKRLETMPRGTVAAIDYLQLLDQRRETPPLSKQVADLRAAAERTGTTILCLSQIARSFEASDKPLPDLSDIRLPNPVDLGLFSKACFLHDGQMELRKVA